MTELEAVAAQGFYNAETTSVEVAKAYHSFCRRHDRPCIWLVRHAKGFLLLMDVDDMAPKRTTTAKVAKLRRQWEARLGYKPRTLDLDAKEASVRRLTEDEATQLAKELWVIVGQVGTYERIEIDPDEEAEEDEA
jgi:hypothetical protein